MQGWKSALVVVLEHLHESGGPDTLSQQRWDHSQRAAMPPFQKENLNAQKIGHQQATGIPKQTAGNSWAAGSCLQQKLWIKEGAHQDKNWTITIEERQLTATKNIKHGSRSRSSMGPSNPHTPPVARNQNLDKSMMHVAQSTNRQASKHKNKMSTVKPQHEKKLQNGLWYCTS